MSLGRGRYEIKSTSLMMLCYLLFEHDRSRVYLKLGLCILGGRGNEEEGLKLG